MSEQAISRVLCPVSVTLYGPTIIHLKGMGCPIPLATNPEAWTGRPQTLPYLVLLQVGFTKLPRSPRELVRSYRTFSPLPRKMALNQSHKAVCFLWHFPSRYRDSVLRSTLPCGARTFLPH
jgi:hypothetical protein